MAGPQDPAVAGGGQLRAGHADREQVIETLKDAFVQGRLTQDELDTRTGQAFASRTYAELAALTADIPAGQAPHQPVRVQNRMPQGHPVRNGAIGVGVSLAVAAAAVLGAFILDDRTGVALVVLGAFIVLVAVPFIIMVTAVAASDQRRSRGQLPPRPGPDGHALEAGPHGGTGHDPVPPRPRTDQTRADLRTHISWPHRSPSSGRGTRAPRGIRPVPDAG
jgi:hypothetical protein